MIIEVSKNIFELEDILKKILKENKDIFFVSYVDGKLDIVNDTYIRINKYLQNVKDKSIIVSVVFQNHKTLVSKFANIIIEMSVDCFDIPTDTTSNIKHYEEYENLIKKMKFDKIINTIHCNSRTILTNNNQEIFKFSKNNTIIIGKNNGDNIDIQKLLSFSLEQNTIICSRTSKVNKKISLYFGNYKGNQKAITQNVINYCIFNKINLYIFQNECKIDIPNNRYIHEIIINKSNLNIDKILNILNDCYIFVGTSCLISELVAYHTNCKLLLDDTSTKLDLYKVKYDYTISEHNIAIYMNKLYHGFYDFE